MSNNIEQELFRLVAFAFKNGNNSSVFQIELPVYAALMYMRLLIDYHDLNYFVYLFNMP